MKQYYKINKTKEGATAITPYIEYYKGGKNELTGEIEGRGYYLIALPVEIDDLGEHYIYGQGLKKCLFTVKRPSPGYDDIAEQVAEELLPQVLYYVCRQIGSDLLDGELED